MKNFDVKKWTKENLNLAQKSYINFLKENIVDINPEFAEVINDNFWELVDIS